MRLWSLAEAGERASKGGGERGSAGPGQRRRAWQQKKKSKGSAERQALECRFTLRRCAGIHCHAQNSGSLRGRRSPPPIRNWPFVSFPFFFFFFSTKFGTSVDPVSPCCSSDIIATSPFLFRKNFKNSDKFSSGVPHGSLPLGLGFSGLGCARSGELLPHHLTFGWTKRKAPRKLDWSRMLQRRKSRLPPRACLHQ